MKSMQDHHYQYPNKATKSMPIQTDPNLQNP